MKIFNACISICLTITSIFLNWGKQHQHFVFVVNDDTLVSHVKCKICTKAMGKEQLLGPKFDSLCKNVGKKKATSTMLSVDNDAFY